MTAKEAPGHTDLMVTPESLTPWLARDGAAKTICDFMGWPEDGIAFADAIRLAEQLGFKLLSAAPPPPKPSGNLEDSVSKSQPITRGTWWFLEAHDGSWAENIERELFTRDPNMALRYPNRDRAMDAYHSAHHEMRFKLLSSGPTEHSFVEAAGPEGLGVPQGDIDPSPKPTGDGLDLESLRPKLINALYGEVIHQHPEAVFRGAYGVLEIGDVKINTCALAHEVLRALKEAITLLGGRSDSSAQSQPKSTLHGAHTAGGGAGRLVETKQADVECARKRCVWPECSCGDKNPEVKS